MIRTRIEVQRTSLLPDLQRQMPFIRSLAINNVAKAAQAAEHRHIAQAFTVRRPQFTLKAVKIKPFATKASPIAVLQIEPPGGAARSDILAKFERGGTKRARDAGALALPDEVRRTRAGVIPTRLRPKAFTFRKHGMGPRATVYVGEQRTFLIKYHAGQTGGIYQRVGRRGRVRRAEGRDKGIRTLYRFTRQASIDARLKFVETVHGTIRAEFARSFQEAIARAVASSRLHSPGSTQTRRIARADLFDVDRVRRYRGPIFP